VELKVGSRWASAVCDTEVVIVRTPGVDSSLQCGGHPMAPIGTGHVGAQPDPAFSAGTALGKRYPDASGDIEVLATKGGVGSLAFDGAALQPKEAKPLPSSD
jgi:hypothetical protein